MQTWIVTGISGSGRIELLEDLKRHCDERGAPTMVHDVGSILATEAKRQGLEFADSKILDVDARLLRTLRAMAIKEVRLRILQTPPDTLHLVGIHATFRWKERLIPGISFADIRDLCPTGFINIVNNVKAVCERNAKNPKWDADSLPTPDQTQDWMTEEEFITEALAEVQGVPMFLVARTHNPSNLADLFFTTKKRIYLSYPITAVREENPELLSRIQGEILAQLEEHFVVFNPLAIRDMDLVTGKDLPKTIKELTASAKAAIKSRTVARDYQFIDQSDAVVVYYMTEKVSPGVLAEIYYAHRNMKEVFVCFPFPRSPFLEGATTEISNTPEEQLALLDAFAVPAGRPQSI